jgi:hypothetical protein
MNTYEIVAKGIGFEVVETLPDGSVGQTVAGFLTQAAAQEWMNTYLRLLASPPPTNMP